MKSSRAFTLIELLVVVLIIGILAAIAVPQYQKAVLKADLHRGINLVESLYQAQQAYFLAHGEFATDIDELDVLIPKDESCQKIDASVYQCDYGRVGFFDNIANVQFQNKPYIENVSRADIAYLHTLKDDHRESLGWTLQADTRYCFARPESISQEVCQNIGGIYFGDMGTTWIVYEIK